MFDIRESRKWALDKVDINYSKFKFKCWIVFDIRYSSQKDWVFDEVDNLYIIFDFRILMLNWIWYLIFDIKIWMLDWVLC